MKKFTIFFLIAFLVIASLPIFEYAIFKWRNPNNATLINDTQLAGKSSTYVILYVPDQINTFTDYIVYNYHFGILEGSGENKTVLFTSFANYIYRFFYKIIISTSGNNTVNGNLHVDMAATALFIQRTLYIAAFVFITYVTFLPVFLLSTIWRRKKT